ncbi:MAG: hypothetical protein QM796_10595 [Chthoniobacteraceae bacterium]
MNPALSPNAFLRPLASLAALLLMSAPLYAGESGLVLETRAVQSSVLQGEPILIVCTFSNHDAQPKGVNVDYLKCSLDGSSFGPNRFIEAAVEHAIDPQNLFTLKPGEQQSALVVLNAWVDLHPGRNQLQFIYDYSSDQITGSPFALQAQKTNFSALVARIRSDLPLWTRSADETTLVAELSPVYTLVPEFRKSVETLLKKGMFQSSVTKHTPLTDEERKLLNDLSQSGKALQD